MKRNYVRATLVKLVINVSKRSIRIRVNVSIKTLVPIPVRFVVLSRGFATLCHLNSEQ